MTAPKNIQGVLPVLLAGLTAIGPFTVNTYLPSFTEIAAHLDATTVEMQQTITAYLAAFSFMTLWHGAISDALGRKKVILGGLVVYTLASFGCAMATRIEYLWLFRALQGLSAGAGIVVGRAVVRDMFDGAQAQRLFAQIGIMFALAPALAPLVGGLLHVALGWRSVFIFLGLMSALLCVCTLRILPETLPPERRQPLNLRSLAQAYREVLSHPAYLAWCLAFALVFAGFFIYVLSAPVFLMRHLGLGETEFLWLFAPAMVGMMGGSWMCTRVAGHWSQGITLCWAFAVMAVGDVFNIAVCLALPPSVPLNVIHITIHTFGITLLTPTLTLLALDCLPDRRGMASSGQTFIQTACNALCASLLAPMLWGSLQTLAYGAAALTVGAGACVLLARRLQRVQALAPEIAP
ncbi:multidrug effflux MFS transporter [Rhodoferax sp.]|uniref:multidrug effflux MFS transporter n=1 Tax=Rhodoferax sp. TaxID=50421 RepID=UPI0025D8900B|nr:multidrug effflux MFS transporter [Rhodoferax sp.]